MADLSHGERFRRLVLVDDVRAELTIDPVIDISAVQDAEKAAKQDVARR